MEEKTVYLLLFLENTFLSINNRENATANTHAIQLLVISRQNAISIRENEIKNFLNLEFPLYKETVHAILITINIPEKSRDIKPLVKPLLPATGTTTVIQ